MNLGDHCNNRRGEPRGWHSRGYLPHFEATAVTQAITYRLADALPAETIKRLKEQSLDDDKRRIQIEKWLDAGHGSCRLRDERNAKGIVDTWKHQHGIDYWLHAWVVMPNHVHVLIEPIGRISLGTVIGAWKSVSARRILRGSATTSGHIFSKAAEGGRAPNKHRVWQPDYWDRFIRNERHYQATVDYIQDNPVKAGLVARAEEWRWSSARSPAASG